MEFTFNDLMESTYRVDFLIAKKDELVKMQTRLNQWLTAKSLVRYKTSVLDADQILFEIVRIKENE